MASSVFFAASLPSSSPVDTGVKQLWENHKSKLIQAMPNESKCLFAETENNQWSMNMYICNNKHITSQCKAHLHLKKSEIIALLTISLVSVPGQNYTRPRMRFTVWICLKTGLLISALLINSRNFLWGIGLMFDGPVGRAMIKGITRSLLPWQLPRLTVPNSLWQPIFESLTFWNAFLQVFQVFLQTCQALKLILATANYVQIKRFPHPQNLSIFKWGSHSLCPSDGLASPGLDARVSSTQSNLWPEKVESKKSQNP